MSNLPSSKLLIDEEPLQLLPSLAVRVGLNGAIVLQQIHYWLKTNEKSAKNKASSHYFDDAWWCYNTYSEWQKNNFPFWSRSTVQRVFESLVVKNLLRYKYHETNNDGMWWTIKYDVLDNLPDGVYQLDTPPDGEGYTNLTHPVYQLDTPLSTTEITETNKRTESVSFDDGEEIQNSSHPVLGDESGDEEEVVQKPSAWGKPEDSLNYEPDEYQPAFPKITHQSAQAKARNHSGKKSSLPRTGGFKKPSKTAQDKSTEAPTRRSTLPAPTQPRVIEKTKIAPVLAVSKSSLDTLIESLAKYPIDATGEVYLSKPISDSGKTARQLYDTNPAYKEWFDKVVVVNYSTWALSAKKKMRSDTLAERATLWNEFIQWVHDNDKQVVRDRSACEAEEDEFLKGRASMTNQQIAEGLTAIRKKHGFE